MSQRMVVLTMPHGGTHFAMYLMREIMGFDAVWAHFEPNAVPRIYRAIDDPESLFIIVKRDPRDLAASWKERGRDAKHYDRCHDIMEFMTPQLGAARTWLLPIYDPQFCIDTLMQLDDQEIWRKGPMDEHAVEWLKDWPTIRKENVPKDLMSKNQLGAQA